MATTGVGTMDKKTMQKKLVEISGAMTRTEGEKDFIKAAIGDIADQTGLKKGVVSRLAKVYHKQTFQDEEDAHTEFSALYENLFNKP